MTPQEELQRLGLSYDPDPPRADGRLPLSMVFRIAGEGACLAFAALEIERYRIDTPERGSEVEASWRHLQQSWMRAVDALSHLRDEIEFWHVVATRKPPGLDGSTLRSGWIVVGRAANAFDAALSAERGLAELRSIYAAQLAELTLRQVTDPEPLLDLLRPAAAPFLRAIRRSRWEPATRAAREAPAGTATGVPAAALLPWPPPAPWGPVMEALAGLPSHAALVVRVLTAQRPGAAVVTAAEQDIIGVATEHEVVRSSRVDRVTMTGVEPVLRMLRAAAEERLQTLREPCLGVELLLTSWDPIGAGVAAVVSAALVAKTARPGVRAGVGHEVQPSPPPPLVEVDLAAGALWEPLDLVGAPELLTGPHEAAALVRTCEPPSDERSPLPCSRARSLPVRATPTTGVSLGEAERYGSWADVKLDYEARFRHAYIVGQTGTGKSTLMLNMVLEDIQAGHGVTVIDPHGPLVADILARLPPERIDDVVLVDPTDTERSVGLNPLDIRAEDPVQYAAYRDRIVEELYDTFDVLYDLRLTGGPMFESYFRTFMTLVIGGRRPVGYVPILPLLEVAFGDSRISTILLQRLEQEAPGLQPRIEAFMNTTGDQAIGNMAPYVTSKLIRFYASAQARRILCQPDCLDFGEVVRKRRIVLAHLPKISLGGESAALLARQMVLRLAVAAMSATPGQAVPHFLFVDEFHNFATERFAQLLAEARKFQLGLVLAHQYTSQLVRRGDRSVLDAILGNVGTVVAFRVGEMDAALLDNVMAPRHRAHDISGLPNFIATVRSVGGLANVPFTLRSRPPSPGLTGVGAEAARRSWERYSLPRDEVDRRIQDQVQALSDFSLR